MSELRVVKPFAQTDRVNADDTAASATFIDQQGFDLEVEWQNLLVNGLDESFVVGAANCPKTIIVSDDGEVWPDVVRIHACVHDKSPAVGLWEERHS